MNEVKNLFNEDDELLFAELDKDQVKYTRENVIFIVRDVTGQIVWLETGNETAGLTHILKRHAENFKKSLDMDPDQIPEYIIKVITLGEIIENKIVMRNNRPGFSRKYYYEGKYYILTGIGLNGFIISAYPRQID